MKFKLKNNYEEFMDDFIESNSEGLEEAEEEIKDDDLGDYNLEQYYED